MQIIPRCKEGLAVREMKDMLKGHKVPMNKIYSNSQVTSLEIFYIMNYVS